MGQVGSHTFKPNRHSTPLWITSDLPPLKFHRTRGENVELLYEGSAARRSGSFCKGIVFTQRPVMVGERICLRLSGLSDQWTGVLRVGFSAHDPSNLADLPKYACPDLTSKPGYWAKALSGRYATNEALIHYYVSGNGNVYFGANGEDLGVFFSGVDIRRPLWGMVDLYGKCTTIELVDVRRNLNTLTRPSRQVFREQLNSLVRPTSLTAPSNVTPTVAPPEQMDRNDSIAFFHPNVGRNARLSSTNNIAWRLDEEFACGYVFTSAPVRLGERISVQILGTEPSYIGSLAFGFTNRDPSTLDAASLPEDSNLLLDRPEYWVVCKDVGNSPLVGDELNFDIGLDGSVSVSKNGAPSVSFMHLDASQKLWAFWDVYGHTSKIRLLGITPLSDPATGRLVNLSDQSQQPISECTVCYERNADSVLYTCGHICMCYDCAIQQWRGRGGGFCPICRQPIRDVIKTFRS